MCWDAVLHKNTIQLIGFMALNFCAFVYSVFQFIQMNSILADIEKSDLYNSKFDKQTLGVFLWLIPTTIALVHIGLIYLSYKLKNEFGWKIYKKIGADPKMLLMYKRYQIFMMLLKLDLFFALGFSIQFVILITQQSDPEFALTILSMPVVVIVLILAVYGIRREDKWIMFLFMFGLICAIAYFLFKLTRIWEFQNLPVYSDSKYYLTLFSCLSLIVVSLSFAYAVLCLRGFGQGLKEVLQAHREEKLKLIEKRGSNLQLQEISTAVL